LRFPLCVFLEVSKHNRDEDAPLTDSRSDLNHCLFMSINTNISPLISGHLFPIFSDPSDPISPKVNPTRVPYSPKNTDGKETYNPNEVLEKPGEIPHLNQLPAQSR